MTIAGVLAGFGGDWNRYRLAAAAAAAVQAAETVEL